MVERKNWLMKMSKNDFQIAEQRLSDRYWRLNNLYYIQNKKGGKGLFRFNWAQEQLYKDMWYLNCVLKARQLGVSTFITLLFLDVALFNSNVSCGIVADNEENAKYIFRKIKFAYDCLPNELKTLRSAHHDSAKELTFSNNSLIRVGTSLRSATFQYMLITEFGKICAEDQKRANEIITGSLNTIATGQYVFIESTAKGRSGAYYVLCKQAQALQDAGKRLSPLEWRFHFYPWYKSAEYYTNPDQITIPKDLQEYFEHLETDEKIILTPGQKAWYKLKMDTQALDMRREYPSTSTEAFESAHQGLFYAELMTRARREKRIRKVYYDPNQPCFSSWDLGFSDQTSVWVYQLASQEVHLIDYIEGSGKPFIHYLKLINSKEYCFTKHFGPHDILQHELGSGLSRLEIARNHGVNFIVVPRIPVIEGIDAVRNLLPRCYFDEERCENGIKALENYRRAWDEKNGCYKEGAVHDWSSDASDSFRYLALSLSMARPGMNPNLPKEMFDRFRNGQSVHGYASTATIPAIRPFG